MASESPWPGKTLCPDEYTEHTDEELAASLTRNGFGQISRMIDGPFFRLWHTKRETTDASLVLSRAEDAVAAGDWVKTSAHLEGLTQSLPSKESIREYALLVAACHDMAARPAQCFEALKETLALDVVEELGPTGSYLDHEHTLRHFRDPYYSKLADKNQYAVWQKRGGKTMEQRAAEMVDSILAEHQTEPLPEKVQQTLQEIVARQQAWNDDKDQA
jgi:hypothetical protein